MKIKKISPGPKPIEDLVKCAKHSEIFIVGREKDNQMDTYEKGRYSASSILNLISLWIEQDDVLTLTGQVKGLNPKYWEQVN